MSTFLSRLRAGFAALTLGVSLLACAQVAAPPPAPEAPTAPTAPTAPATPVAPVAPVAPPPAVANLTPCPAQRSEICPSVHKPVCAQRDTGVRCIRAPCPSEAPVTFSNACSACRDPKVYGYVEGACGQGKASM
jgi:hypothetical protein